MFKQLFIFFLFTYLLTFTFFPFTRVLSANDDGFFSVNPEDYYNFQDDGEESEVSNKLQEENNTSEQNALPTPPTITPPVKKHSFNIAVSADWGCEKDTKKTAENIQKKNPELVISAGDASYHKSSKCWFDIINHLNQR